MKHQNPKKPSDEILAALKDKYEYDSVTGLITNKRTNHIISNTNSRGYVQLKVSHNHKHITHKAHHVAWYFHYGRWPTISIDHINGIKTDNRISNLQELDQSGNTRKGKLGKYDLPRGVTYNKRDKKYQAGFTINRKYINLGLFDTIEEADKVAQLYWFRYVSHKQLLGNVK